MTSFVSHTSVDCHDAFALSEFWKQVLEYVDDPDDANEPGHDECWIQRPDGGHPLLFIQVPEAKQVKNRIHLDLRPSAGSQAEELERLLGIGARQVADLRGLHGPGTGWIVLADPEGNEFCLLNPAAH
ncbi:glyoxalase [Marmoricola sp. Leaf446]|uniref:VOC family protein n=1 Tax=Marmoricola sp. Leaf446 TaxID=1736379 RepID=UPI000700F0F1|nr:VOC family protein [Marmoricola sp. Leaf446]KQT93815.1 glyoxalase [Marmoricola sp. Leaf446]